MAELERDGHDVEQSRKLRCLFVEIQELNVADRDRLRKELAELKE